MKRYFATMAALGLLASTSAYAQQAPSTSGQQGQQAQQGQQGQQTAEQGGQRQEVSPRMVKQLQARLHQQGYYDGKVTGNWDEDTSDALENFQEANGLQPSGQLDGPTIFILAIPARQPGQQQQQAAQSEPQGQAMPSGPQGGGGEMGGPMMGQMMGGQMGGGQTASGQTGQGERPFIEAYRAGFQNGFAQGFRHSQAVMAARQGQGQGSSQGSSVPPQQYRGMQPQQFQGEQQ